MIRACFVALGVSFLFGCGSGAQPGPKQPSISSFAATPSAPIPVGGSATLSATFDAGTGVIMPGSLSISSGGSVTVSPSSTTTYTLVVTGGGGKTANATTKVTVNTGSGTLDTQAGTLEAPDGAKLSVPFGALDGPTSITIESTTQPPPNGITALSPVYSFKPEGLLFARPVEVTLPLPAGVTTGTVYWSRLDGSGSDPIGGTVDSAAHTITVTTAHFSLAVIGPASTTRTVSGLGKKTYISATSRLSQPIDFGSQGVEALVKNGSGAVVPIAGVAGTGAAAGTFTIPGVPDGEYILHSGTQYLVTSSNTPDLGFLLGGRPTRTPLTSATILNISVTGLEPWETTGMLEFYVSEVNNWDFITDRFATLNPGDTSTSFAFDLTGCDAVAGGCAEITAADHAVLAELSPRTSSTGVPYTAMSRLIEFAPFALSSGGSVNVSGAMRDISQESSISLDFRGSQWDAAVSKGHPAAVSTCGPNLLDNCFVAILAQPGAAEDGFYSPNADPLFLSLDGTTDLTTGTLNYGSPAGVASGNWGLLFDAQTARAYYPPPLPGSSGLGPGLASRGFFNGIQWTTSPAAAQAAPIVPPVSMVQNPTIAGIDLFAGGSGIGLTPTLTWAAPSIGSSPFYRIDVSQLAINSQNKTVSRPVASLITTDTSLTLPAGILTSGTHYVFTITATVSTSAQSAAQLASSPFKSGLDLGYAFLSSGVFTP
jgi:ZU5 domain